MSLPILGNGIIGATAHTLVLRSHGIPIPTARGFEEEGAVGSEVRWRAGRLDTKLFMLCDEEF